MQASGVRPALLVVIALQLSAETQATLCYVCADLLTPQNCSTQVSCWHTHACGVELDSRGLILQSCIDRKRCPLDDHTGGCCDTDLCNNVWPLPDSAYTCTFDTDLCIWEDVRGAGYRGWSRRQGDPQPPGPPGDSRGSPTGHFLSLEAGPADRKVVAALRSPDLTPGSYCLQLDVLLGGRGQDTGVRGRDRAGDSFLQAYLVQDDSGKVLSVLQFGGNHDGAWHHLWQDFYVINTNFRLIIQGSSLRDIQGSSLRDSLGDNLRDIQGSSLRDNLGDSLRDSLGDSQSDSQSDSLGGSLCDSLGDSQSDSLVAIDTLTLTGGRCHQ